MGLVHVPRVRWHNAPPQGARAPVAPSGFDPLNLSPHVILNPDNFGLVADDPIGTAANDGSLADFTQATAAAKPTLRGGASLLNGHYVVEHDGVDDYLDGPNLSALTSGHAFIVVKVDADPPGATGTTGLWTIGTAEHATHFPYTDSTIYDGAMSTARKTVGDPTPSLASWRIYEVRSATNDWEALLDGTSLHSTSTNTVGLPTTSYLGRDSSYGFKLDGRWAYFFLSSALSSGDASDMRGWLQTRFGL